MSLSSFLCKHSRVEKLETKVLTPRIKDHAHFQAPFLIFCTTETEETGLWASLTVTRRINSCSLFKLESYGPLDEVITLHEPEKNAFILITLVLHFHPIQNLQRGGE